MTDTQAPLSTVTAQQAAEEPAFQTGTKAKPTITNESVLSELENIYKQRKAEQDYFLTPLKYAAVGWWNPQGPGVGLPLADRMRQEETANLQKLQSDIATAKIGIGELQNARSALRGPQATPSGAPQTGVSAVTQNTQGGYSYQGVPLSAQDFNVINNFLIGRNKAAADAYLEKLVSERNKFINNPSAYTPVERFNPDLGKKENKMPIELQAEYLEGRVPGATPTAPAPTTPPVTKAPIVGADANIDRLLKIEGGYNPKDGASGAPVNFGINQKANKDVDVKNLTEDKAREIYKERYWKAIDGDKLPPATAMVAMDAAANQGQDYAKKLIEKTGGDPIKMLDQREMDYRKLAASDDAQKPFLNQWLTRINDLRKEVNATVSQAPTTAPRRFASKAEQEAYESSEKTYLEKQASEAGTSVGKRRAAIEDLAPTINSKLGQVSTALNILDTTPEAVGIAFRDKVTGTIISAYKAGLVPLSGQKDLEPVFAAQLPREIRVKREQFDNLATNIAAEYRRELNKGLGQVSNYETQMSEKATGLSVSSPVEANRYFATLYLENLRSKKQMIEAWDKYPDKSDYAKFERSPQYQRIIAENEERLKKIFPPNMESGLGTPVKTTPPTRRQELDKKYGQ